MNERRWEAVDQYLADALIGDDPALDAALAASDEAGLPAIAVSPLQGKLLHLLARMQDARAILEIGTLGGYSTIWLARALPADGRLVSLEFEPRYAEVARANVARAGLDAIVDIRVGPALETLPDVEGPFDLVFIDADKQTTPAYFEAALERSRPGGLIIGDNVVRGGSILDGTDASSEGMRRFVDLMAAEPRVEATVIQTVGVKGYDGFAVALVDCLGRRGLEVLVRGAVLALGQRRALARLALARRRAAAGDAAVERAGLDLLLDVLDRRADSPRDRPVHLRLVRDREVAADVLEERPLRLREVARILGEPLDRVLTRGEDCAASLELRLAVGVGLDQVLHGPVDGPGVLIHAREKSVLHEFHGHYPARRLTSCKRVLISR